MNSMHCEEMVMWFCVIFVLLLNENFFIALGIWCFIYEEMCHMWARGTPLLIIIQTFVMRAVSANILNLRRRQSLGEEDGGSEV